MTNKTIQNLEQELAQCRQTIADLQGAVEKYRNRPHSPERMEVVLPAMIEATADPLLALDLNNRLIFANSAFRRLFLELYDHDPQPDDDVMRFMTEERKQFWKDINARTLAAGTCRFELQYYLQDTRYDIEWSCTRVSGKDGQPIALTQFGRDITPLRLAEETLRKRETQLQHAQKMESVGALASGVAHEFNNIMSIVLGNLELSLLEIQADNPIRPYIDDAKAGILRAKKVTHQLVDFSRKSDGQRQHVEVHTVAVNALSLLRASIPSHIEFHQHIESCPPVVADPAHIHQMIINLCTHAADSMTGDGGVMTVTLEHITLKAGKMPGNVSLPPGKYAKLTVADTGRGMDAQTLDRIYEPDIAAKDADQGPGLGLAVVHSIVESYGGCITAQTKPGRGSKFEVYFPTAKLSVPDTVPAVDPADLEGHERILFVDDEPRFVILTQRQLENMGYKVEVFTSSIHALERFKAAPDEFDLLITDVAMPKMTGENLVRQIRMLRPVLPVILCTGYSEKVDQQTAAQLGCEYLVKPIEIDQLAQLIRKTLDNRS